MTTWRTPGAAKLNLTLEVIGKREDGFHDLASVALSLDLVDDVQLTRTDGERSITYTDDHGRRLSIETSDDIIIRAWTALERRCPAARRGGDRGRQTHSARRWTGRRLDRRCRIPAPGPSGMEPRSDATRY